MKKKAILILAIIALVGFMCFTAVHEHSDHLASSDDTPTDLSKPLMEENQDTTEQTEAPAKKNESDADLEAPDTAKPNDDTSAEKSQKSDVDPETAFYAVEIPDDVWLRMQGKSYKADCTVPREDLRYLHVLHKDLNGQTHIGEMVCNTYIADDVLAIFKELYEADYPIEKIRLVDDYNADDEASMEDNNSSSFNFRFISHTTKVSKHGLGLAVDINTLYNPYTKVVDGKQIIEPVTAAAYLDRDADFPYKIDHQDLCYRLFTAHGFEWGGDWHDRKDYQHFEMPDDVVNRLYP